MSASLDMETVLQDATDGARLLTGARYGLMATVDPSVGPSLIDNFQKTGNEFIRLGAMSGLAAELPAACFHCSQSRLDVFADQVTLEVGDPGK